MFFFILFVCFSFCLHIQYINSFVKCIICDDELKRLIRITVAAPLFRIISMNRIFCSDFSIFDFQNEKIVIFWFFSFWISFFDIFFFVLNIKKLKKFIPHLKTRKLENFFYGTFDLQCSIKKNGLFVKLITLCQTIWMCVCDWIKMLTAILAINEFKLISNYILKLFYMQLRCNTTLNTMYDIT